MRISDWSSDVCSSDLLRLPRTLLALGVGAMLGLSGAALQGYLRNPLAEPSVLGASNAAALGAVAALSFGLAALHPLMLPLLSIGRTIIPPPLLLPPAGPTERPLTPPTGTAPRRE